VLLPVVSGQPQRCPLRRLQNSCKQFRGAPYIALHRKEPFWDLVSPARVRISAACPLRLEVKRFYNTISQGFTYSAGLKYCCKDGWLRFVSLVCCCIRCAFLRTSIHVLLKLWWIHVIIEWQRNRFLSSVLAYIVEMLMFNPGKIKESPFSCQLARRAYFAK
jgi:hypothetical protein